jgi:4-amino-4-deoxy-L-arabinose transferase-like glycosyltransferase
MNRGPGNERIGLSILFLIGLSLTGLAILSFFGIDNSILLDEGYSVYISSHNFEEIIASLRYDTGPPLYYMLLAVWMRIFGISEPAIRSLSSITYILTLIPIYLLAKSLYNDRRAGFLSAFLYMVSPLAYGHAQNARMYSLLSLLVALSILFFFRVFLIKTGPRRDLVLYILVNILGTFTHYWFFFALFPQVAAFIFLRFDSSFKKLAAAQALSVIPFFIIWAPVVKDQMSTNSTVWMTSPGLAELRETIAVYHGFWFAQSLPFLLYALFLIFALVRIENSRIELRNLSEVREFLTDKRGLTLLILFLLSILLPFTISQWKPIYFPSRGPIIALAPLAVFWSILLARFANRQILICLCYILLTLYSVTTINNRLDPIRQLYSDKATAMHVMRHASNSDALLFTSLSRPNIDYYLRLMGREKDYLEFTFPSEIDSHPGWRNVDRMLSERHKLEREADDLVARLSSRLGDNKNIWVFYGQDEAVGEILKSRLDENFTFMLELDLRGLFHNKVLLYKKNRQIATKITIVR